MKLLKFFLFALVLNLFGCHSNNSSMAQETNEEYIRLKSKFDNKLIDQFPENLTSEVALTTANADVKKNSVGIFLYEYKLSSKVIDSLGNYLIKKGGMDKYKSSDTCMLIVNRFETKPGTPGSIDYLPKTGANIPLSIISPVGITIYSSQKYYDNKRNVFDYNSFKP